MTNPTKWQVRPAKTQISLGIHPVLSESSLSAQWVAKDPSLIQANSEDSDLTGRMSRLIWVFAGRTCYFVGFGMRSLIYFPLYVWCIEDLGGPTLYVAILPPPYNWKEGWLASIPTDTGPTVATASWSLDSLPLSTSTCPVTLAFILDFLNRHLSSCNTVRIYFTNRQPCR